MLSWPKHELLVQLEKIEAILRPTSFDIDFPQELANEADDLWQRLLIRIVVGRMLQYSLQEQRVTSETRGWFRQVTVQLEFARFGQSFSCLGRNRSKEDDGKKKPADKYLHKMIKCRIRILLLLKLVLPIKLMCTIRYKRSKMRYSIQHNVANTFHNRIVFLTLVKRISEPGVHRYNIVYVPEDLFQEVCTSWLGYNIFLFKAVDPHL